jgi:uncharacterized membrane protein YbhN (UPF0104 family)
MSIATAPAPTTVDIQAVSSPADERRHPVRTWLRRSALVALFALFAVELKLGWPSLSAALKQLHTSHPGWIAAALVAEVVAMGAYARMQRQLLRSSGLRVALHRHVALAFAAHSLNETLPGGPAFSIRFNFQQMRRFGATPAVASWSLALSGVLSSAALAAVAVTGAVLSGGTPPWYRLAGLLAVAVLITVGIRQVARRPEKLEPAIRALLAPLNRLRRRSPDEGLDRIRAFIAQLGAVRLTLGHGAAAAGLAVLNWAFDAFALWMCLRAVSDGPVGAGPMLLAFSAAMAAGTLTIVPGGLGVVDSALILGLVTGGVSTATAIAAVVLYRIITLGFVIGAGWITWLVIRHPRGVPSTADPATAATFVENAA